MAGGHVSSKLSEEIAIQIKEAYRTGGQTQKEISKKYGVSRQTISDVLCGKIYSYVTKIDSKSKNDARIKNHINGAAEQFKPVGKIGDKGNTTEQYESVSEAARDNGITPAAIRRHCSGNTKLRKYRYLEKSV